MPRQLGCAPWCGCGGEVEGAARERASKKRWKYFHLFGRLRKNPRPSRCQSWTGQSLHRVRARGDCCGCGGEVEGATARKPEATPIRKYFRIGRGWRHPRPSRSKSWTGQRQDARGRSGGTCQRHPLKRYSRPVSRTGNSSRALGLLCNFPQGGCVVGPKQAAACAVVMNTGSIPLGSRPIASVRHHGCQVG